MKHFINKRGKVYAYALNGSQDNYIKEGLKPISDAELIILRRPTAEEAEATRIEAIKQAAGDLILSSYPAHKQANMLAEVLQLINKRITSTLTTENEATLATMQSAWDWIKSVRAKSNQAEDDGTEVADIVWP